MKRRAQRPAYVVPAVCPTCGSKVGSGTRRCLVCGADLNKPGPDPRRARPGWAVSVMRALVPFLAVACLAAMGVLLIFGAAGAVPLPEIVLPGQEPTETSTVTPTFTPTATLPPTMTPLPTPLPPIRYVIKPGDTILAIAIEYDVAPWAINELNNLAPDAVLSVGQVLLIPIPTATPRATLPVTPSPMP